MIKEKFLKMMFVESMMQFLKEFDQERTIGSITKKEIQAKSDEVVKGLKKAGLL